MAAFAEESKEIISQRGFAQKQKIFRERNKE
jgi:hypothetical protein